MLTKLTKNILLIQGVSYMTIAFMGLYKGDLKQFAIYLSISVISLAVVHAINVVQTLTSLVLALSEQLLIVAQKETPVTGKLSMTINGQSIPDFFKGLSSSYGAKENKSLDAMTTDELKALLEKILKDEDFDNAAIVRDEIAKRENVKNPSTKDE